MASVQELLLAAQSKAPRSSVAPLLDLLDTGISGYTTGQGIRDKNTEIAYQLVKKAQIEQEMAQKAAQEQRNAEANARIQQRLRDLQQRKGVTQNQKLTERIAEGKDGNYTQDFTIEEKSPSSSLSPDLLYRMQKDAEEAARKKQEQEKSLTIPGFNRIGNVMPLDKDVSSLRSATASYDNFKKNIGQLQTMTDKYGTYEKFGSAAADMRILTEDARLQAKNLYDLGVLNGRDYELISNIVPPTNEVGAAFTLKSTRKSELNQALQRMADKLSSKAKSLGYEPAAPLIDAPPVGPESDMQNGNDTSWSDAEEKRLAELEAKFGNNK